MATCYPARPRRAIEGSRPAGGGPARIRKARTLPQNIGEYGPQLAGLARVTSLQVFLSNIIKMNEPMRIDYRLSCPITL